MLTDTSICGLNDYSYRVRSELVANVIRLLECHRVVINLLSLNRAFQTYTGTLNVECTLGLT